MAEERLVFASLVEGLFLRGLAGRLDASARAELRTTGLDLDRPLLPAYPAEVFRLAVAVAARHAHPGLPEPEAYYNLGERTVLGLEETLVGRAQIALSRLVGAMRALQRLPRNVKIGCNYTSGKVVQLGPSAVEVHLTGYALPHGEFQAGTLMGVLTICGAQQRQVSVTAFDAQQETVSVRASWAR